MASRIVWVALLWLAAGLWSLALLGSAHVPSAAPPGGAGAASASVHPVHPTQDDRDGQSGTLLTEDSSDDDDSDDADFVPAALPVATPTTIPPAPVRRHPRSEQAQRASREHRRPIERPPTA